MNVDRRFNGAAYPPVAPPPYAPVPAYGYQPSPYGYPPVPNQAPAASPEAKAKKASMKKSIKKAHRKAKFAGALYLLGTIALFAFLFLSSISALGISVLKLGDWEVSVLSFYKPFTEIGKGYNYNSLVKVPVAAVYALILIVALINLLRSLSCLGWLSKKKATRELGYNRNVFAMEKMGNLYSGTLVIITLGTIVVCCIGDVTLGLASYIALGAGIFLHFFAGLIGGNIPLYDVEDTVVETKRESALAVFFFRNLLQILFVGAIVYFFVKASTIRTAIADVISQGSLTAITGDVWKLVALCLQVAFLLWIFVLVNHAINPTEFNRDGMSGRGMKNHRVFTMFALITAIAWLVVTYLSTKAFVWQIGAIAGLALLAFVFDCVIKTRKSKATEDGEAEDVAEQPVEQPQQYVMPPVYRVPLQCITQPGIFLQPNGTPVMVMPMQRAAALPVAPSMVTNVAPAQIPAPAPAPVPVQAPAPVSLPAPAPIPASKEEAPVPVVEETPAVKTPDDILGVTFQWDPNGKERTVVCPSCGKTLTVKEGAPGYRCAECGKVFLLRKPAQKTENE